MKKDEKYLRRFEDQTLDTLSTLTEKCSFINPEFYNKYEVKRGLRDISGRGVLAGLTEIGEVHSYIIDENESCPCPICTARCARH